MIWNKILSVDVFSQLTAAWSPFETEDFYITLKFATTAEQHVFYPVLWTFLFLAKVKS